MPIQLERIERLIQAAEIFLRRDRVLRAMLADICAQIVNGRMTLEYGFNQIATHLKVTVDYHPAEAVILEERTRYQMTYKRSLSERQRMRARRAGHTYQPQSTQTRTKETFIEPPPKTPDWFESAKKGMEDDDETLNLLNDFANEPEPNLPVDPLAEFDTESAMTPEQKANYEAAMKAMGMSIKKND